MGHGGGSAVGGWLTFHECDVNALSLMARLNLLWYDS